MRLAMIMATVSCHFSSTESDRLLLIEASGVGGRGEATRAMGPVGS